jgi:hypothetical protein
VTLHGRHIRSEHEAVAAFVIVDVNASGRIEHQAPRPVFGKFGYLPQIENRTNLRNQLVDRLPGGHT